jgi:hypothetical protein
VPLRWQLLWGRCSGAAAAVSGAESARRRAPAAALPAAPRSQPAGCAVLKQQLVLRLHVTTVTLLNARLHLPAGSWRTIWGVYAISDVFELLIRL